MINLHSHSFLSDGAFAPSELARRFEDKGYTILGITDHIDISNIEIVIPQLVKVCAELNKTMRIKVIPGAELTYISPESIADAVKRARKLGAKLVLVHGETIVEPVPPGTNRMALKAEIDILAHPGLISLEEAKLAAEKDVFLEISCRKGHSLANGHIVGIAREVTAGLIIGSDAHSLLDLITPEMMEKMGCGAGLSKEELDMSLENARRLAEKIL
ncbi:MAG: phosphatase YcdX [Syntrophomonadaceae bacterium]|nr:phosphatase YcdX [Bacillota bacterium]